MGTVIDFPGPKEIRMLDWAEVEEKRKRLCPKVPRKALSVLNSLLYGSRGKGIGDGYIMIDAEEGSYPRDNLFISQTKSDVLWILDLLDRFGGEITWRGKSCVIKRKKKRYPVYFLRELSNAEWEGINRAVGSLYEHFSLSRDYRLLGKDFPELDLMMLVLEELEGKKRRFSLLTDKTTGQLLWGRVSEGMPRDHLLTLGN